MMVWFYSVIREPTVHITHLSKLSLKCKQKETDTNKHETWTRKNKKLNYKQHITYTKCYNFLSHNNVNREKWMELSLLEPGAFKKYHLPLNNSTTRDAPHGSALRADKQLFVQILLQCTDPP